MGGLQSKLRSCLSLGFEPSLSSPSMSIQVSKVLKFVRHSQIKESAVLCASPDDSWQVNRRPPFFLE